MDHTCTSALDMYRLFNVLCWLWNIYEGVKNRVFIPPLPTFTRDISRHVQGLHCCWWYKIVIPCLSTCT